LTAAVAGAPIPAEQALGGDAMILGLSLETFTLVHVAISLVGILAGLIALFAMIGGRGLPAVTGLFLAATVLTSVTGYFFPSAAFGPPQIIGAVSLVVLAAALYALYGRHLAGLWRPVYVITATIALYLNCFVGVVQAFQKIPALNLLAPTGTEPPFAVAQGGVLVLFVLMGFLAVRNFRPKAPAAAPGPTTAA
jgi:hypothetical protein